MSANYLLGIDAGTSVIKSVIFDLDGHELVTASQATALFHSLSGIDNS